LARARGTYPICLNCDEEEVKSFRKDGFDILEIFELSGIRPTIGGSPWHLSVANKAAHPNAARAFVNWLLSKEAMEIYSRGYGAATLRTDVDESFLNPQAIPKRGVDYFDQHDWKWALTGRIEARERVGKILRSAR
jgi:ABC-type glycerol-3-phosphate transport system substrate-binding protein